MQKPDALKRIASQFKTAAYLPTHYEIIFVMPAITASNANFTDHKIHKILKRWCIERSMGEWFACDKETAVKAVLKAQTETL